MDHQKDGKAKHLVDKEITVWGEIIRPKVVPPGTDIWVCSSTINQSVTSFQLEDKKLPLRNNMQQLPH